MDDFFSTACKKESVSADESSTELNNAPINISGIYKGQYSNSYLDPGGNGYYNLHENSYLKVDSVNSNYYSMQAFGDSLLTDTLWPTSFDTYDNPVLDCQNFYHYNVFGLYANSGGINFNIYDCDSIELEEIEYSGMSQYSKTFRGRKIF